MNFSLIIIPGIVMIIKPIVKIIFLNVTYRVFINSG